MGQKEGGGWKGPWMDQMGWSQDSANRSEEPKSGCCCIIQRKENQFSLSWVGLQPAPTLGWLLGRPVGLTIPDRDQDALSGAHSSISGGDEFKLAMKGYKHIQALGQGHIVLTENQYQIQLKAHDYDSD